MPISTPRHSAFNKTPPRIALGRFTLRAGPVLHRAGLRLPPAAARPRYPEAAAGGHFVAALPAGRPFLLPLGPRSPRSRGHRPGPAPTAQRGNRGPGRAAALPPAGGGAGSLRAGAAMSGQALEELSALAAIYCEPDACEVLAVSGDGGGAGCGPARGASPGPAPGGGAAGPLPTPCPPPACCRAMPGALGAGCAGALRGCPRWEGQSGALFAAARSWLRGGAVGAQRLQDPWLRVVCARLGLAAIAQSTDFRGELWQSVLLQGRGVPSGQLSRADVLPQLLPGSGRLCRAGFAQFLPEM